MVSLNTTSNYSAQATKIWQDMLSGVLSFDEGRALFIVLRQQQGDNAETASRIADSLIVSAKEQRQAGLASGAKWAGQQVTEPETTPYQPSAQSWAPATSGDVENLGINNPLAAFLRRFNLPGYGGSPVQAWRRNEYTPLQSVWQAQSNLNPGGTSADWSEYLTQQPGVLSPKKIRQQALSQFGQARTQFNANQDEFLGGFRGYNPEEGQLGGDLTNFLQTALMGRFAQPVAQALGRRIPGILDQYQAETTGRGDRLLDYLNEELRLGR